MIDITALIERLRAGGHDPDADIAWAETLCPPANADDFALEIIFVVCNIGMRFTTARRIYLRVAEQLEKGRAVRNVFGHLGKAAAIEHIWAEREKLFSLYNAVADEGKLDFIETTLPWVGKITKYHVAKNFGLPLAKPDVHLQRLADTFKTQPQALCEEISRHCGLKVATVDTLLWRAAAVGVLDTSTGLLR